MASASSAAFGAAFGAVFWETESLVPGARLARVFSPSNIALAKYWGKRDAALNLPANGSISASIQDYGSFTTVEFHESFAADSLILNGHREEGEAAAKAVRVLDPLRAEAGVSLRARVQSANNFPTAAGLASSASGLSAVALAGSHALGLSLPVSRLSEIARRGSGSACRSLLGGFVEWARGELADGTDSVAAPLAPVSHWPLGVLACVVNRSRKSMASTGGMERTRLTSPYFPAWVESAQASLRWFREAIQARDFERLADLSESACLRMHASAMAATEPILYWEPETIELMRRTRALRSQGTPAFFTIDAGPNVIVFCEAGQQQRVASELAYDEVTVLSTSVGEGARPYRPEEWEGER